MHRRGSLSELEPEGWMPRTGVGREAEDEEAPPLGVVEAIGGVGGVDG